MTTMRQQHQQHQTEGGSKRWKRGSLLFGMLCTVSLLLLISQNWILKKSPPTIIVASTITTKHPTINDAIKDDSSVWMPRTTEDIKNTTANITTTATTTQNDDNKTTKRVVTETEVELKSSSVQQQDAASTLTSTTLDDSHRIRSSTLPSVLSKKTTNENKEEEHIATFSFDTVPNDTNTNTSNNTNNLFQPRSNKTFTSTSTTPAAAETSFCSTSNGSSTITEETTIFSNYKQSYQINNFMTLLLHRPTTTTTTTTTTKTQTKVKTFRIANHDAFHKPTSNVAICEFIISGGSLHFPHAVQQFLRCFSYWNENNALLQRVVISKGGSIRKVPPKKQKPQAILIWKKGPRHQPSPYLEGIRQLFRDVFNVMEVSSISSIPTQVLNISTTPFMVAKAKWYGGPSRNKDEGYQMKHRNDAIFLREQTLNYYQLRTSNTAGCYYYSYDYDYSDTNNHTSHDSTTQPIQQLQRRRRQQPTVGILNRVATRGIENVNELQDALLSYFSSSDSDLLGFNIVYFENKTFLEQIQYMSQVDILITSHGAQLTSLPFMSNNNQCSSIFEYFPSGYYVPHFFGTLATISGIQHASLYTGKNHYLEWDKKNLYNDTLRFQSRQVKSICIPIEESIKTIQRMIQHWHTCCDKIHIK